jgi:hypothetical protein
METGNIIEDISRALLRSSIHQGKKSITKRSTLEKIVKIIK